MSSIAEKVAHQSDGLQYSEAEVNRRNPHAKKKYKPRLSTKVKWALGDAMERSIAAQGRMRKCLEWLEETHCFDIDERAQAHLGKLELQLFALAVEVSEMERILAGAIAESKAMPTRDVAKK